MYLTAIYHIKSQNVLTGISSDYHIYSYVSKNIWCVNVKCMRDNECGNSYFYLFISGHAPCLQSTRKRSCSYDFATITCSNVKAHYGIERSIAVIIRIHNSP